MWHGDVGNFLQQVMIMEDILEEKPKCIFCGGVTSLVNVDIELNQRVDLIFVAIGVTIRSPKSEYNRTENVMGEVVDKV